MGKLSKIRRKTSKSIDAIERKPTPHGTVDVAIKTFRASSLAKGSSGLEVALNIRSVQLIWSGYPAPICRYASYHRAFPPVWRPTYLAHALFACLADKSTSGISLTVSGTLQSGIVTGKIRPKEPTTQTARADTSNIQFAHLISPVSYFHPPPPSFLLHCIGRSLHWPPENSGPLSSPGANCLHARHATIQIARTAPTATDPPKQGISIHH